MKIFLTLDYELFFGSDVGTVQKSIIEPTNKLLDILDIYNIKAIFFIDSGFILKLQEFKEKYTVLEQDYQSIINQIKYLDDNHHEIALHIHPHWEDSYFDGEKWILNTSRYKLDDFNKYEIEDIVFKYKMILEKIIDKNIFTFRAGGWCIQPFDKIRNAFKNNNIKIDSTLYKDGYSSSQVHYFDFRGMEDKAYYKFEDDPLIENKNGFFTEVPIASIKVSPLFFWKFAFFKVFGKSKFKGFGDGYSIAKSKWDKLRLMLFFSNSVVSIDGFKVSLLEKAYKNYLKKDFNYFVIIGHPKALTPYSLEKLEEFILKNKTNNFTTYSKEFYEK